MALHKILKSLITQTNQFECLKIASSKPLRPEAVVAQNMMFKSNLVKSDCEPYLVLERAVMLDLLSPSRRGFSCLTFKRALKRRE